MGEAKRRAVKYKYAQNLVGSFQGVLVEDPKEITIVVNDSCRLSASAFLRMIDSNRIEVIASDSDVRETLMSKRKGTCLRVGGFLNRLGEL